MAKIQLVKVEIGVNGLPCRVFKHYSWKNASEVTGEVREMDRRQAVSQVRLQVWQRAGGECENCSNPVTINGMHMHEEVHRGKGGDISLDNSRCLCYDCHIGIEHGDRTPRFGEKNEEVDIEHDSIPPAFIA